MRLGTSLAVAVFALARAASAQSLPQWTGELTVGEGRHTARAGNVLFFDDYGGLVRVGLSYRITGTGPRAAYVKLDYATDGDFADNLVCAVTPAQHYNLVFEKETIGNNYCIPVAGFDRSLTPAD